LVRKVKDVKSYLAVLPMNEMRRNKSLLMAPLLVSKKKLSTSSFRDHIKTFFLEPGRVRDAALLRRTLVLLVSQRH
jgi:hypothetical protein